MSGESQATTTTLHVVIGGLCLLVRDEKRSDGKKLHVLMPAKGHAAGHAAVLMYDPVYGCPQTGEKVCKIPLDGVVMELSGNGKITGPLKIGGVLDEECMGGRPVKRKLLDGPLDAELKARITIAAGREGPGTNTGGLWELGDCTHYMATLVHWEIPDLPAGNITLRYTENGSPKTRQLTPDAAGEIELFFLHVPSKDLPQDPPHLSQLPVADEPALGDEADHMKALYPLVEKHGTDKAPKYKGKPRRARSAKAVLPAEMDGFDFQCIAATAPAEPKS